MLKKNILLAFCLLLANFTGLYAVTNSTISAGDWNTPGIWSLGHVPLSSEDVGISHNVGVSGAVTDPVISITMNSAVTLTIDASQSLTVTNGLWSSVASTLVVNGNITADFITYNTANLTIGAAGVVDIAHAVSFTAGTITNGNNLLVGTSASSNLLIDQSNFTNNGTVNASGNVTIQNVVTITNNLSFIVGGNMTMTKGTLNNTGSFVVEGTGSFSNDPIINNSGTLDYNGLLSFNITGSGAVNNTGGTINAHSSLDFTGTVVGDCPTSGAINYWGTLTKGNCTLAGATLPVELTHFSVSEVVKGVLLEWSTASEKNNDIFNIEHSINGEVYSVIGTQEGKGNSSVDSYYSFNHQYPINGMNYYRLQQVDYDGTATLSKAISVCYKENYPIVYPTIAEKGQNISIDRQSTDAKYMLISVAHGYEIVPMIIDNTISTENIPRDSYRLQIVVDEQVTTVPITVY